MSYQLDNHVSIEYVDEYWFHLHASYRMTSVVMERYEYDIFRVFLRGCLSQIPDKTDGELRPSKRVMKTGNLTYTSEGPDEGHFNILIDTRETRLIIGVNFYQIEDMLNQLEN